MTVAWWWFYSNLLKLWRFYRWLWSVDWIWIPSWLVPLLGVASVELGCQWLTGIQTDWSAGGNKSLDWIYKGSIACQAAFNGHSTTHRVLLYLTRFVYSGCIACIVTFLVVPLLPVCFAVFTVAKYKVIVGIASFWLSWLFELVLCLCGAWVNIIAHQIYPDVLAASLFIINRLIFPVYKMTHQLLCFLAGLAPVLWILVCQMLSAVLGVTAKPGAGSAATARQAVVCVKCVPRCVSLLCMKKKTSLSPELWALTTKIPIRTLCKNIA